MNRHLEFERLPGTVGQHHIARTVLHAGQRTYAHTHDFPELFLVEQGAGTHACNGREHALCPGALVLVAPQDVHYFACLDGAPVEFLNLALAPHWLDAFLATLSPSPGALARSIHLQLPAAEHEQCARALQQLLADGGADPTLLPAAMALVLRTLFRPDRDGAAQPPPWLARWRTALFSHRGVGQPLRYWQELAGVSPEHLARCCRRHYNDSPSALIVRARLEWVCEQMRHGDVKIVDLAYDAGFDNLSYFYRCFRRVHACTPLQWIARERAGPVPF